MDLGLNSAFDPMGDIRGQVVLPFRVNCTEQVTMIDQTEARAYAAGDTGSFAVSASGVRNLISAIGVSAHSTDCL
jgi:hypothetical protein